MNPVPADVRPAFDPALAPVLVAADRWSLWRTLSRGLAHGLANAAQVLAIEPLGPGARAEAQERLGVAIARLSEVHRAPEPGPTVAGDVLEDVQALQRLQAGFPSTELRLELAPGLPAVRMGQRELAHVLLALVTNAKQAAGEDRATIQVRALASGTGVGIVVEDDGPGVASVVEERIFEPGVTTRAGALGLGLAVSRHLAREAGGTLERAGRAAFRLDLPAWPVR